MTTEMTRIVEDHGALLLAPDCPAQFSASLFQPDHWPVARRVGGSGRGNAWFVADEEGNELVLRHYLRGGLVARISRDLYIFNGEEQVRSFHELKLLQALRHRGLPVPEPVAASYQRVGRMLYRAQILVRRIAGAKTFLECLPELSAGEIEQVGQTLRHFQDEGLEHVDLNCKNILLASHNVYLIDFDRCVLHGPGHEGTDWREANLRRLLRSLNKELPDWPQARLEAVWQSLRRGYGQPG